MALRSKLFCGGETHDLTQTPDSGGDWTAGLDGKPYSIGLARCDTAFGPCTKLTTDETGPWFGPHCTFLFDPLPFGSRLGDSLTQLLKTTARLGLAPTRFSSTLLESRGLCFMDGRKAGPDTITVAREECASIHFAKVVGCLDCRCKDLRIIDS